ncbi:MAG: MFS transporter, partial [Blastocatellia bacterium]
MVPGSLAIIGASFPENSRGKAIGTWSGFTTITSAIGPVLGGWLIAEVSWRAAFFLSIPIAILVLAITFWRVPESRAGGPRGKLDVWGAAFVTAGLGCVVYGLIRSSVQGFSNATVIASLAGGGFFLTAFFIVESRVQSPMLPLPIFRSRTFSGTNLQTFLLYAALGGALFFLPLNLIQVQGYSATAAGAAFLPFILIIFLLSRWSGGLVARIGARLPLVVGPLISAVGFALLALPGVRTTYWTGFFPGMVALGFGMAVSVAPLTTTIMNSVDADQSGIASGINNAVSRTAGLIAVAALGILMLQGFGRSLDRRLTALKLPAAVERSVEG